MNYVNILMVAERVYKSGIDPNEVNLYDMIEWVGEAIAKIGVPLAYIEKITNGEGGMPDNVEVTDYRGVLPTDIVTINGVRDASSKVVFIRETGTFRTTYTTNNLFNASDPTMLAYRIEEGYIYTNVEEVDLEIAYTAYKTDCSGYPMIPDDERFITACEAYCMYKISRKLWLQDRISKDKYRELEQDWLFYVKSARNSLSMPSVDAMESLKNQITKMRTSPAHHSTGFAYLNQVQNLDI